MRDGRFWRRSAPGGQVICRVRVADERHVVATCESPVDRGPDAGIRLRASHNQASDSRAGQHLPQVCALKRVAVDKPRR